MNSFLERAHEIHEEIVANRRTIHQFGGVGMELPETTAYVMEKLTELGLEPVEICPSGVVCTIGKPGSGTILLRADMDALPIEEKTGLPFACTNGTMHACGHDMHPAMLLGAAKLLKEREAELKGTVKLMFQPGEEVLEGARAMVNAGVLENPKVDAAVAMHVGIGRDDCTSGYVTYVSGSSGSSADEIWVTIKNEADRGDANIIDIACHLILSLQELSSVEVRSNETFSLMFNAFACDSDGGKAAPRSVTFKGVMIAMSDEVRDTAKARMESIVERITVAHRRSAVVEYTRGVDPLVTDKALADQIAPAIAQIVGDEMVEEQPLGFLSFGAEDFAAVCRHVPGVYLNLGAGSPDEGYVAQGHRDNVIFNEDVLPVGAAIYANVAYSWLADRAVAVQ